MKYEEIEEIDNTIMGVTDEKNILKTPVNFNKKSFTNKMHLSYEMATYWDLSLTLINDEVYKVICDEQKFIDELDDLRVNNQFDVALLKFLHFLNPLIGNTLKNIIDIDMSSTNDDMLLTKGKLKYRGGELIPHTVYSSDSYHIKMLPDEGEKVFLSNKMPVILGSKLGDGGEGIVYKTNRKNEVIKLIKPDNNGNIRSYVQNRLEQMVKVKISNPNVIWPIDTVYNEAGNFIGFTMKYIKGVDLKHFSSSIVKNVNDNADELNINQIDKKSLCKLILSILDTISYLHEKNIIIGDIKLENFMIKDDDISNVYFIDCDSYQVGNFPSLLVSPGFIPPEIDPINLGKQNCRFRTFGNENFAIFSLLFHLVFRGKTPYSQQIHDDAYLSEVVRVTKGLFPYFLDKEKTLKHAPKGMEEPIWAHLPSYVKKAFLNCGNRNGVNFGEENRLSAKQWKHIFTCYLDDLNASELLSRDPKCNQYHFGLEDSIDYDLVDFKIASDGIVKRGLSMEETIMQRFRNNDYVKNMILTKTINKQEFPYVMFNHKLYNNGVLLSLELIKHWKMAIDFIKEEPLGVFGLNPTEFAKITSNKAKKKYHLALFNLVKALNPNIYIAYDGLIFESLNEYSEYLNNYYFYYDKSIIPYDILEENLVDNDVLHELKKIYSKNSIDNSELDFVVNLLSETNIYSKGICYKTLGEYVLSIFEDELNITPGNLLLDRNVAKHIFRKYDIDMNRFDFSRRNGYCELSYMLMGYVPFKFKGFTFTSLEDIVSYSKLDLSYDIKFRNIGRWITSGTLKQYTNFYPRIQKLGNDIDVFKMVSDNKLDDWCAGHLFYLVNVHSPVYVTKDNIVVESLKDLMEVLTKINDIESFTNKLYSDCLFETWCELHKKPTNRIAF